MRLNLSFRAFSAGTRRPFFAAGLILGGVSALGGAAFGQTADVALVADASSAPTDLAAVAGVSSSSALPDAPEPQLKQLNAPPSSPKEAAHIAPLRAKYIPAGWKAQPLGLHGKLLVGATDLYSFSNLGAIVLSAAYAHVTDGQPNYGVNSTAFGKRVGAAAVRETSQGIFTDMVFAPLLHEDSRYYQKGPEYNPVKRTLYAITRPLVTRTDGGRSTVNGSLLLGYAAAAALTPAYYPQSNRNFHDVASTYGGSIGGAALGYFVEEFSDDVLEAVHLKRKP